MLPPEREAQLSFQLPDLVRKRGLRDVQLSRGFRKVRRFRHRQEIAEMPQFDQFQIHRWHLLVR